MPAIWCPVYPYFKDPEKIAATVHSKISSKIRDGNLDTGIR
jgi:hypothetical protein